MQLSKFNKKFFISINSCKNILIDYIFDIQYNSIKTEKIITNKFAKYILIFYLQ